MMTLKVAGCTAGEYVGNGKGEDDTTESVPLDAGGPMDADPGDEHQQYSCRR